MKVAENIVSAYNAEQNATNGPEWKRNNPIAARIVNQARRLKTELYGDG